MPWWGNCLVHQLDEWLGFSVASEAKTQAEIRLLHSLGTMAVELSVGCEQGILIGVMYAPHLELAGVIACVID